MKKIMVAIGVLLCASSASAAVTADDLRRQLAKERVAWAKERAAIVKGLGGNQVDAALRVAHAATGVPLSELRAVASCESGFRPWATNGQYIGLFQLGSNFRSRSLISTSGVSAFNPYANALAAAFVADKQGWRQWECSPRGAFRR